MTPARRLGDRAARAVALSAACASLHGALPAAAADADSSAALARWEAGLVAGGGYISDYPGSTQSHARGLIAPVLIYRGPVLRIDERGIRSRLFDSPDFELDLAASAAFDARNNEARQGMPALDYLFGIGPQFVYLGWRRWPGEPSLRLKARALLSTDFRDLDGRGVTVDAELLWRFRPLAAHPASTLTVGVQPTWASRALHRYFYEVEPAQALPERPAYRARGGYLGTELNVTLRSPLSDELTWFVALRGMSLRDSANTESPLHRRNTSASIGAGIVWTPWRSE